MRRRIRRALWGAALLAAAALFALAALCVGQAVVFLALTERGFSALRAVASLMGLDAAGCVLLAWLATRRWRDPIAVEAIQLRDDSLAEVAEGFSTLALWRTLLRLALTLGLQTKRPEPERPEG